MDVHHKHPHWHVFQLVEFLSDLMIRGKILDDALIWNLSVYFLKAVDEVGYYANAVLGVFIYGNDFPPRIQINDGG